MQNESREDLLEALCLMEREGSPHPAVADLARRISRDEKEIRGHLEILSEKGDLILQGDLIEITSQGREIGSRIMRKHRVLECFFTEMLGMEPKAASSEACALEHGISDEVVDRIGNYMEGPGTQASRRQPGEIRRVRTLLEFPEGMELIVSNLKRHKGWRRLVDLGVFPGQRITLVRKLNTHAVVIKVKGCDIALSPEVAEFIFVEHAG
jgi:DtxR family Mn-dependent transcriptional regulator